MANWEKILQTFAGNSYRRKKAEKKGGKGTDGCAGNSFIFSKRRGSGGKNLPKKLGLFGELELR